jgi:mannose-6-phosphate isomerase-like protein (cupin superfamily)
MMPTTLDPKILPPQAGESYLLAGDLVTFKAVGAETGGAYTLFEGQIAPGSGMPPHIHQYEEEAFFVVAGTYTFGIGERVVELGPGGFIFGPRGIPHSFRNSGGTPGRLLMLITPGGLFEQFTAEVGQPLAGPDLPAPVASPDIERLVAVAAKYGIDFLPPPAE